MELRHDTTRNEMRIYDNGGRSFQRDAPDEYLNPGTGLCGSCGAPESAPLVPVGSTDLMADPEVDMLYAALQPHMREFIKAYMETLTIVEAAEVVGISRQSHYYWTEHVPGYREVFEVAELEVRDQWRRIYADRTKKGLTERTYDADGNLKHTRIREDASLLKMQMMAVDPETYNPERSKDTNVNIVVVQNKEGW